MFKFIFKIIWSQALSVCLILIIKKLIKIKIGPLIILRDL